MQNKYFPPITMRAPLYGKDAIEVMPEGMDGYRIETIYGYYDEPLIYTVSNGVDTYFAYWMGNTGDHIHMMSYQPLSKEEQQDIENGTLCLGGFLVSKPSMIVHYDRSRKGTPIVHIERDVDLSEKETPKKGSTLTIFEVNQLPGKVAVYYASNELSLGQQSRLIARAISLLFDSGFDSDGVLRGDLYERYKTWFNTNFSHDGDNIVPTLNFELIPLSSTSSVFSAKLANEENTSLESACVEFRSQSAAVATIKSINKHATMAGRTLTCEPSSDEGSESEHDELSMMVLSEMERYHKTLEKVFDENTNAFAYRRKR